MPQKKTKTDWKKELDRLANLSGGQVLLEPGTRKSTPGTEEVVSRGRVLGIMEENRRKRKKRKPSGSLEDRLKGLFGGG
jgi:hypothetical protein